MTRMTALPCHAITWNKSMHILTCLDDDSRIAITCSPWELHSTGWFAPVYIIVGLGTHTDGSVIILYKNTIIRYGWEFTLRQFHFTKISVYYSLYFQDMLLQRGYT